MATDQALHGLDRLELAPPPPGPDLGRIIRKAWGAAWPKLLAVGLVLGIWELVTLTGWKHYVLKGPGPVFADLWDQMQHGQLWSSIGVTLRTAALGYAAALVIGSAGRVLLAPVPPLC